MTLQLKSITAEELLEMGDIGRCELVRGEIVTMAPAGAEHGDVAGEIFGRIWSHARKHRLGKVYAAETGFTIARNPDTTRAADVAFVRKLRVPPGRLQGYFPGPPDLVVEVVSPGDRMSKVRKKVTEWLDAGAVSVWVVDPSRRRIDVHHGANKSVRYGVGSVLTDEAVLPGFAVKCDRII